MCNRRYKTKTLTNHPINKIIKEIDTNSICAYHFFFYLLKRLLVQLVNA